MIKLILYRIFNPILTAWAIKILSWEPPKQKLNPIRDKVIRKLALPQLTQQTLTPIQKPLDDYKRILNEHESTGKPIKPVKHRKPIPKDTICPKCEATYQFIYSNAIIDSVKKEKSRNSSVRYANINGSLMIGKSVLHGSVLNVENELTSKSVHGRD